MEQAREVAARPRVRPGRRVAVTGFFDVLLAEHARELARVSQVTEKESLWVVLVSPLTPVLPARARAELLAALGMVDYVVIAEGCEDLENLLRSLRPDHIVRAEADHERRRRQLIEHAQRRQSS